MDDVPLPTYDAEELNEYCRRSEHRCEIFYYGVSVPMEQYFLWEREFGNLYNFKGEFFFDSIDGLNKYVGLFVGFKDLDYPDHPNNQEPSITQTEESLYERLEDILRPYVDLSYSGYPEFHVDSNRRSLHLVPH